MENLPTTLVTRELWWNIDHEIGKVVFYALAIASILVFIYGFYSKLARIFSAKNSGLLSLEDRFSFEHLKERTLNLLTFGLLHKKTSKRKTAGASHALTYGGFVVLWIVTTIVALQENVFKSIYYFQGTFYKIVSAAGDWAGIAMLIGVIFFAIRRYVVTSKYLDQRQNDWIQLAFLGFFAITGFVLEGFRLAATNTVEDFAPIGNTLAGFFKYMNIDDLKTGHAILWWSHSIMTFAFVALIPYTKFAHIFLSPLTVYFKSTRPRGALSTPFSLMALMEAEAEGKEVNEEDFLAGVFTYDDLSWKTLLDSEACTACGRCHVVCPAQNTDKPLSPKHYMLDIKGLATKEDREEIYAHIPQDVLWSCTTCGSCVEQCPVLIEHVDSIVDMRRGLLASNMAPSNLQATLKNIRTKSNPWGMDPNDREKWIQEIKEEKDIDVKLARANKDNFEYLYWVGSPGAYDDRNKKVTKANVELFTQAGLDFAVLGNEEKSSGDIARRAGDEGLYQEIVIENIEIMKMYGVKKIITQCPHVYNTFKNEYADFGLEGIEVYHHTEILAELLEKRRLSPKNEIKESYVYHDPCYLGRYNRVFDAPRQILEAIPGLEIKEIENQKETSTCCGGGGAQMWYEMPGSQINTMRLEELSEAGAAKVSVACPYCSIMLSSAQTSSLDGANAPESEDVALTLAKAVF